VYLRPRLCHFQPISSQVNNFQLQVFCEPCPYFLISLPLPLINMSSSFFSKSILSLAALSYLATAAPHACQQQQQQKEVTVGKAVYFMTNDAENAIVALPIGKDGTLSKGMVTKTGGAGSVSIDGASMQPALTDALIGQSSLTVVGNVSNIILQTLSDM
jgi:hypothetical protein